MNPWRLLQALLIAFLLSACASLCIAFPVFGTAVLCVVAFVGLTCIVYVSLT